MGFNPIETLATARRLRGKAEKNRIDSGFAKAQVTGEGEAEKRLCHALCGQQEGGGWQPHPWLVRSTANTAVRS